MCSSYVVPMQDRPGNSQTSRISMKAAPANSAPKCLLQGEIPCHGTPDTSRETRPALRELCTEYPQERGVLFLHGGHNAWNCNNVLRRSSWCQAVPPVRGMREGPGPSPQRTWFRMHVGYPVLPLEFDILLLLVLINLRASPVTCLHILS